MMEAAQASPGSGLVTAAAAASSPPSPPTKRRKIATSTDPKPIPSPSPHRSSSLPSSNAAHYSGRVRNLSERRQSSILGLRSFNNWVKSVLLSSVLTPTPTASPFSSPASSLSSPAPFPHVLDLCGGKGGDLKKFDVAAIGHLCLADHATGSVRDAVERYRTTRCTFPAQFIAADCHRTLLSSALPPAHWFDVVSCQFALHYGWETEETARNLILNATQRLAPGGRFVCTIPDAEALVGGLRGVAGTAFGNGRMQVRFPDLEEGKGGEEKEEGEGDGKRGKGYFPASQLFGVRYYFHLEDAIDDLPEYLIPPASLVSLCALHGLRLHQSTPFHDFIAEHIDDEAHYELLKKMKVVDPSLPRGTPLTEDEWDILNVYRVVVFVKEQPTVYTPHTACPRPPYYTVMPQGAMSHAVRTGSVRGKVEGTMVELQADVNAIADSRQQLASLNAAHNAAAVASSPSTDQAQTAA